MPLKNYIGYRDTTKYPKRAYKKEFNPLKRQLVDNHMDKYDFARGNTYFKNKHQYFYETLRVKNYV